MTVVLRNKNTGREITKFFVVGIDQTESRIIFSFDSRIGVLRGCSIAKAEYEIVKVVE